MNDLKELLRIVSSTKVKNVHPLGQSDTLTDKLYSLLRNGSVKNDQDAIAVLYPGRNSKVGLYQVKEKLQNKLLDAILVLDPSDKNISSYTLTCHECIKNCAAFEKIALKGGGKVVIRLGDKILKVALVYNLCSIIVRVTRVLMRKAVFVLRDEKK